MEVKEGKKKMKLSKKILIGVVIFFVLCVIVGLSEDGDSESTDVDLGVLGEDISLDALNEENEGATITFTATFWTTRDSSYAYAVEYQSSDEEYATLFYVKDSTDDKVLSALDDASYEDEIELTLKGTYDKSETITASESGSEQTVYYVTAKEATIESKTDVIEDTTTEEETTTEEQTTTEEETTAEEVTTTEAPTTTAAEISEELKEIIAYLEDWGFEIDDGLENFTESMCYSYYEEIHETLDYYGMDIDQMASILYDSEVAIYSESEVNNMTKYEIMTAYVALAESVGDEGTEEEDYIYLDEESFRDWFRTAEEGDVVYLEDIYVMTVNSSENYLYCCFIYGTGSIYFYITMDDVSYFISGDYISFTGTYTGNSSYGNHAIFDSDDVTLE